MKKVRDLPMDGSASGLDGAFRGVIEEAVAPLIGRMDSLEERMDSLERHMANIENLTGTRFGALEGRMKRMENGIVDIAALLKYDKRAA